MPTSTTVRDSLCEPVIRKTGKALVLRVVLAGASKSEVLNKLQDLFSADGLEAQKSFDPERGLDFSWASVPKDGNGKNWGKQK